MLWSGQIEKMSVTWVSAAVDRGSRQFKKKRPVY